MTDTPCTMPWLAHYGELPHTLPDPGVSMFELMLAAAREHPDTPAWEFFLRRMPYRRFIARVERTARALLALGVRPGEPVTIALPNCPQVLELFYAVNRIGAVANMVHPLSAPEEFGRYAALSASRLTFTLESFAAGFQRAVPDMRFVTTAISDGVYPLLRPALRLTEAGYRRRLRGVPHLRWRRFLSRGRGITLPPPKADPTTPAVILYSGGTTGRTKAVLHSDRAFNAAGLETMAANRFSHADGHRMLAVLPNFHGFGLGIGIHAAIIHGCTVMLLPRFSPKALLRLLRRRPSYVTGVPTMFEALLRLPPPKGLELSSLRGVYCGGDSLPVELKARFDDFLAAHGAGVCLREGYGATECVAACCLSPEKGGRAGSIGIPFPDVRMCVCDTGTAEPLPCGEDGELCVCAPTLMLGYLNDPEETALALRRHADGRIWLHTGDIGRMDSDGFFYFRGRLKRMIVTSGYNVYPTELEEVICRHPKVTRCCCVGVPDPLRMHRIRACIVPAPDVPADAALRGELTQYFVRHIARYALPREIRFYDRLPTTPLGKTDHRALEGDK